MNKNKKSYASSHNFIRLASALTLTLLITLVFASSASATKLENIEEINGLSGEPLNISANTTFENNRIYNISEARLNSGYRIDGYTFYEYPANFEILKYDDQSSEWKVKNTDFDLQSNNISSVANIESFFGACSGDNVLTGINDDGSFTCVDPESQNLVENLSKTLAAGNVANQSINMDGNNINNVNNLDLDSVADIRTDGTDAIVLDGSQNVEVSNGRLNVSSGDLYVDQNIRRNGGGQISIYDGAVMEGDLGLGSNTVTGTPIINTGDGSSSDPGIQFGNDGDTGIYRNGADNPVIVTGGSDALRATSSQNIEIPNGDVDLTGNNINQTGNINFRSIPEGASDNVSKLEFPESELVSEPFPYADNNWGRMKFTPSRAKRPDQYFTLHSEDVYGSNTEDFFFQLLPKDTSSSDRWSVFEAFEGNGLVLGTGGSNNPVVFQTGRNERMTLTGAGDLELNNNLAVQTSGASNDISIGQANTGIDGGADQIFYASGTEFLRRDNSQGRSEFSNGNLSLSDNYLVDVKQINLSGGTTIDGSFDIENSNITLNENWLKNASGVTTDRLSAPGSASEVDIQDNIEMNGYEIQSNDGSEFTIADLSQIDDGFTVQGNVDLSNNNLTQVEGLNSDGTTTNINLNDNGDVGIPNGNLSFSENNKITLGTQSELRDAGDKVELLGRNNLELMTYHSGEKTGLIVNQGAVEIGRDATGNEPPLEVLDSSGNSILFARDTGNIDVPNGNLSLSENNIQDIEALQDGSGTDTVSFDGSNNVEIQNGNLELSSDVETTGGTLIYDQSSGEYFANPGTTSSTNPVFARNGDQDTGVGFSSNDELILVTGGAAGPKVDSSQQLDLNSNNIENAEQIAGNSGTASDPLYVFDLDANTGVYSPGDDRYGISTGGTAAVEIDSGQNVSIESGDLQLNSNDIEGPDQVDGVDLDNPGNAIEISGDQYRVIANSLNDDEIADNSLTNSSIDSFSSFTISDLEVSNDLTGTGIVNTDQLSENSVTTNKIGEDQVQNADINNEAVESVQIADNTINNSDIANSERFTLNGVTLNSGLNMTGDQIVRIGTAKSNFTAGGGLDLGARLNLVNNDIQNAPRLQNTGNIDLNIDSDTNTNDRTLDITHDENAENIARFNESGDVGIPNGDLYMNGNRVRDVVSVDGGDAVNQSYVKRIAFNGTFLQRSQQGRFRISGTGTLDVNELPYQPDSVRFTVMAPVQDSNTEEAGSGSSTGNFAGVMSGYARMAQNGIEEFSMSQGVSGNSPNSIREKSTDNAAISITYGDTDGAEIGEINASLTSFDPTGFTLDVNKFNIDESGVVVQYQAFRATNYSTENGTDISEDGSLVKEDAYDVNFERNLDVSPDGDGSVTVDTEPEGIKDTLTEDNVANTTLNMDGNNIDNVNQISGNSAPVEVSNDVEMTGSSPKIDLGSGMSMQRKNGDVVISD